MKRIVIGITNLALGGAERVLVDLVNRLKEEYAITILTFYPGGELEKEIEEGITLKSIYQKPYEQMSKQEKIKVSMNLLFSLKKIYQENVPKDITTQIAFLEGPMTRLFKIKNANTTKITWIHNDISLVFGKGLKAKIKKWLNSKVYRTYDKLIFVSKDNQKKFQKQYPKIEKEKQLVITNYLDAKKVLKKAEETAEKQIKKQAITILSVSRLVPQKAIDRLVKVHARLIKQGIFHKIYVIGEGPEREKIEKLIKEEEVQDTFLLLGKQKNPYPYIRQADALALLSYFEGYGMVLEEAKILGKFIMITDTAAREAIENYANRVIFENSEEGIYQGLKEILQNPEKMKEIQNLQFQNEKEDIILQIKTLL